MEESIIKNGADKNFLSENIVTDTLPTSLNMKEIEKENTDCIIIMVNNTDVNQDTSVDDTNLIQDSVIDYKSSNQVPTLDSIDPIFDDDNMDDLILIPDKYKKKKNKEPSSEIKRHKCLMCGYCSNRRDSVETHVKSVHLKLEQFKCNLCDYVTRHKSVLNRHKNNMHIHPNKFKCQLCESTFNKKADLKNHKNTAHLNHKHKCHLCDYASSQKNILKSHIDSVHLNLREYKCDLCDYAGNRKLDLKSHMEAIHVNLKKYKCHNCDFAANRKGDLKSHIELVHLKMKNYKCHLCDRATYRKKDLKKHLQCVHKCKTIVDPISNNTIDTCGIFTLEFDEF